MSGIVWKNSLLNPWENDHFLTFSPIFPPVPPKNLALPSALKLPFSGKYENRAIITQSFVMTSLNLWLLEAFENYLLFINILTIINKKHHVIEQLP